jgi:hypothetical protein
MKRTLTTCLLLLGFAGLALAQSTATTTTLATTPANLDPDSFGHNVVWLGQVITGNVYFDGANGADGLPPCESANGGPLVPPQQCVIVTPPDPIGGTPVGPAQPFEFDDLASITIPGGSAHSIIWPVFMFRTNHMLRNTTSDPANGVFNLNMVVTLESAALKGVVDPDGVPYNGKFVATFPAAFSENQTLAPSEFVFRKIRADGSGNSLFETSLFTGSNIPPNVVKKIFSSPMTIRFGLAGSTRLLDVFNSYPFAFVAIRLFGDH